MPIRRGGCSRIIVPRVNCAATDGLALDPASGNLFIASSTGNGLFRLNLASGAISPINLPIAPFGPSDLTFGRSGDLFVANFGASNVVRVNVATGASSVAASGSGLMSPTGIAFGPDGNLFVASSSAVLVFNPNTGSCRSQEGKLGRAATRETGPRR